MGFPAQPPIIDQKLDAEKKGRKKEEKEER